MRKTKRISNQIARLLSRKAKLNLTPALELQRRAKYFSIEHSLLNFTKVTKNRYECCVYDLLQTFSKNQSWLWLECLLTRSVRPSLFLFSKLWRRVWGACIPWKQEPHLVEFTSLETVQSLQIIKQVHDEQLCEKENRSFILHVYIQHTFLHRSWDYQRAHEWVTWMDVNRQFTGGVNYNIPVNSVITCL